MCHYGHWQCQINPLYQQTFHQAGHNVGRYRQMLQSQHQDCGVGPLPFALKDFRSRRLVSRFRCGCHGLHVDSGQYKPVAQRVDREYRFVLSLLLIQQKMNITLCLTALHIGQVQYQPLPYLLSSFYMTTGSLPSFSGLRYDDDLTRLQQSQSLQTSTP